MNRIQDSGFRIQNREFTSLLCVQHKGRRGTEFRTPTPESSKGFSIVTAIFLLVVLSFLGIAMVSFSTSQHQSSAMDVMGSRAYQAARAGIEWQAYYVANSPSSAPAAVAQCGVNNLGALGGTLSPFSVTVNCAAASHVEGASTIWIYDVNSVAKMGGVVGDPNYVERVVGVKMGR